VETARSFEKRRQHANLVGEQNDLQAREITYIAIFSRQTNSVTCSGQPLASAMQICTKNWSWSAMEQSEFGNSSSMTSLRLSKS